MIIVHFLWWYSVFVILLFAHCVVDCSVRRRLCAGEGRRLSLSLGGFCSQRLSLMRLYIAAAHLLAHIV